jgi:hypothetical protein
MTNFCWSIVRHVAVRHAHRAKHHWTVRHGSKLAHHRALSSNLVCRLLPAVLAGGLVTSLPPEPSSLRGEPITRVEPVGRDRSPEHFEVSNPPFAFGGGGGLSWFTTDPWPLGSIEERRPLEPFITVNDPPTDRPGPPITVTRIADPGPPGTHVTEPISLLVVLCGLAGLALVRRAHTAAPPVSLRIWDMNILTVALSADQNR